MLKTFIQILCLLFLFSCGIDTIYIQENIESRTEVHPDKSEIENSIFLIGDAGRPSLDIKEPTFNSLERSASINHENNLIVFLGDNVYPNGLVNKNERDRETTYKYLLEQTKVVQNSKANGVFIPGNHDWAMGKEYGYEYLKNQTDIIDSLKIPNLIFAPQNGCPGPEVFNLTDDIRIVILDTQWWLNENVSFKNPENKCIRTTEDQVIEELNSILSTDKDKHTIVVGHHPFETHGFHGGFFNWQDHLFPLTRLYSWMWIPLPVVGSSYPLLRNSIQDLPADEYKNMINKIESVFEKHPPLVYASGHEHVHQVIKRDKDYLQLVTGKGISYGNNVVNSSKNTLFAYENEGFLRIDFLKNRKIRLSIVEPIDNGDTSREVFSMWLK